MGPRVGSYGVNPVDYLNSTGYVGGSGAGFADLRIW
jgi:hypothetical protein